MSVGPVGTTRNRTDLFLKYRNQARGTTRALGTPGSDRCGCQSQTRPLNTSRDVAQEHGLWSHLKIKIAKNDGSSV
jgi:hypothetical protein